MDVKLISSSDEEQFEEELKKFLTENSDKKFDIKYSTTVNGYQITHNALVIITEKENILMDRIWVLKKLLKIY